MIQLTYLKNVKPLLESSPAKFYEMLLGKDFASFIQPSEFMSFTSKVNLIVCSLLLS